MSIKLRNSLSNMCKFLLLVLTFSGMVNQAVSQSLVQLTVVDSANGEPVPFAAIINSGNFLIGSTDLDGRTKLPLKAGDSYLVKSTSYKTLRFVVSSEKLTLQLAPESYLLQDVVILPGINPAHRLIEQAVANRDRNNPKKSCRHCYNAYNKLVFLADEDSLNKEAKNHKPNDTSFNEMKKFFDEQYLFMTESLTERFFDPPSKGSEKIIANRVSGFQNPIFSILATELQSFGYYEDYISLLGIKYLNPISKGSTSKYLFLLKDTTYEGADTIYSISFEPRKGKSFKGLKGILKVHTKFFALQNFKAQPALNEGGFIIHINQLYEYIKNQQWFPVQLNAKLFLPPTISVNGVYMSGNNNGYITNIRLGEECKVAKTDEIELEVAETGRDTSIERLNRILNRELTQKEKNTYQLIDSIGDKENFDKRFNKFAQLATGKIPVGFINIDLNRLLGYNHYEGFRVGLGISTNYKISKRHVLSGYGAYGFKDKAFKYGGDLKLLLYPRKQTLVQFSYRNDITEAAAPADFNEPIAFLSPVTARNLYLRKFDANERWKGELGSRLLKHFHLSAFYVVQSRKPLFDYSYSYISGEGIYFSPETYFLNETGGVLRFAFREKFVLAGNSLISKGTKFPVLHLKYTQSINQALHSDFTYSRIDLKAEKAFLIRNFGKFTMIAQAGKIDGKVPYSLVSSFIPSFAQFELSVPNSFEAMRMNEFAAKEYLMVFLSHNFLSNLFYQMKSKPQLELFSSFALGREGLSDDEMHNGISFISPEKGYYESGIRIHSLIRSKFSAIGITLGYRYGPYSMNKFTDNAVIKFTTGIVFE